MERSVSYCSLNPDRIGLQWKAMELGMAEMHRNRTYLGQC
jgi:hypothetical protein